MATEDQGKSYYQGSYGLKYLAANVPSMKSSMQSLIKNLDESTRKNLYLTFEDGKLHKPSGAEYQIKFISQASKDAVQQILLKEKKEVIKFPHTHNITNFKSGLQLYVSGGRLRNVTSEDGKAIQSPSPTTFQQEDGFIVNLKEGELLEHQQINKKIGFNFSLDWYCSYERSFKAFTEKIISQSKLKDYEFYRDSDAAHLPKFLCQITDEAILPAAKDNWNPADMWCVKINQKSRLQKEIDTLYTSIKNDGASIEQLNKFIETEFIERNLIGVSLKKVTKQQATVLCVTRDAKYSDSIKFKGYSKKDSFDVLGSYFRIIVKMSASKQIVDYEFHIRPKNPLISLTQNAEGRSPNQKTFDGAIDKRNVIGRYFPKADDIVAEAKQCLRDSKKSISLKNAAKVIAHSNKKYEGYAEWLSDNNPNHKCVSLCNTEQQCDNQHQIQLGLLNTYYAYLIDTYKDHQELFKDFYLSAKKVNAFSSIHYRIF